MLELTLSDVTVLTNPLTRNKNRRLNLAASPDFISGLVFLNFLNKLKENQSEGV